MAGKNKSTIKDKTNAMRQLDQAGITYKMSEYPVDEEDLSGVHAAKLLGVDEEIVFKTLVARDNHNNLLVFVIPSPDNLDLKKAAKVSNSKSIELIHTKELLGLTGYIRGGCSPIGMKKKFPTFIDETAILYDEIYFSAGKRGVQIIMDPQELAVFIDAEFFDLVK